MGCCSALVSLSIKFAFNLCLAFVPDLNAFDGGRRHG